MPKWLSIEVKRSGGGVNLEKKIAQPSTVNQTISPSEGYDGLENVLVLGSSNLTSSNIKSGVTIFNVTRGFVSLSGYCGYFRDYTPSSQTTSVTLDVT